LFDVIFSSDIKEVIDIVVAESRRPTLSIWNHPFDILSNRTPAHPKIVPLICRDDQQVISTILTFLSVLGLRRKWLLDEPPEPSMYLAVLARSV
jgi:hypothetical protein